MLTAGNANIIDLALANRGSPHGFTQERSLQIGAAVRFGLRYLLQLIVIAGIPAVAAVGGGCVEAVIDTDCVDTIDRTFELQTPADPQLQFNINSCRVDVEACSELCRVTLVRNSINDVPTRCKVSFDGDLVDVKVWYEVYIGGDSCPGEDVFAAPPPPPEPSLSLLLSPLEEPQMRGLLTRTFDSLWSHGGRTCHA